MADQWEYFMVEVVRTFVNDGTYKGIYWFLYPVDGTGKVLMGNTPVPALGELNTLGAQGWELVGNGNNFGAAGTGNSLLIFKRRKP